MTTRVPAEAWETLHACPLCGSADYLKDAVVVRAGTIVTACTDCEYVFMRRRPSSSWFEEFYARIWDHGGREGLKQKTSKQLLRKKASAHHPNPKVERFCAPYLPPGSRVLDVGAGYGESLLAFQVAGHRVEGIERSEHRANYLSEVHGIPCTRTNIEEFSPAEPFDLICMHHVYEHVSNPAEVMSHLTRILKPGGRIYIAVPDLWQEFPPQSVHFVPHLHWYSAKALAGVLARHNFSVLHSETSKNDIQILGTYQPGIVKVPPSDESSGMAFWQLLQDWVARSFFDLDRGRYTIVWYKDNSSSDQYWNRRIFRGSTVVSETLGVARRLLSRAPKRHSKRLTESVLPRVLPRFLTGFLTSSHWGIMTIKSDGPVNTLPLTIEHGTLMPSVWVK